MGLIEILAVVIMLLVCLIASLIARSSTAQVFYKKIDAVLLELIPGYAWTNTVLKNFGGRSCGDSCPDRAIIHPGEIH